MSGLTEDECATATEAMENAACFVVDLWSHMNEGIPLTHEYVAQAMIEYGLLEQRPMTAEELAAEQPNSGNDVILSVSDGLLMAVEAIEDSLDEPQMEVVA